jgi:hypothetical protein
VIAHRRALQPFPRAGLQTVLLHQPNHALPTDALGLLEQVFMNPRTAVPVLARLEGRAHQHAQLPIALGVRRF